MNQEFEHWILGVVSALVVAGIGAGIKAYMSIIQRVTKSETLLELLVRHSAIGLHSPHTPELDALLEKYNSNDHTLTVSEWKRLRQLCEEVIKEPQAIGERRSLAYLLKTVADQEISKTKKQEQYEGVGI